jgi:hypothetical protein
MAADGDNLNVSITNPGCALRVVFTTSACENDESLPVDFGSLTGGPDADVSAEQTVLDRLSIA